jgi:6-pyruvoyltetrahydropterin/6-carboxytetrahydropterin synthase
LDKHGMSVDFRNAKTELAGVLSKLDHLYLNELPQFQDVNPSAENLAKFIYEAMAQAFSGKIDRVTVWETATSAVTYWPGE